MKQLVSKIEDVFNQRFDGDFVLIKSPGRVNLIGEHTDYNDGYVLPAAIDKVIVMAIAANGNRTMNLFSVDMDETYAQSLDEELVKTDMGWPDYIVGAVDQLQKAGYSINGFDCVFGGDIPIGAGLSSSAALEGAVIYGLSELFDLDVPPRDMALLGQQTENEFVGVNCGIMDQFINIHGEDNKALKLDCRTLEYELYPFGQEDVTILLCDTKIRRELAGSEYNIRRQQCERGVSFLKQYDESIDSLRDVPMDLLNTHKKEMDTVIYNRCRYVIEENDRVVAGCQALVENDLLEFGRKMYQSHDGLRDLYEVSCEELDVLVDEARKIDGVFGSRMMGGGFGGCTINLVKESAIDEFRTTIRQQYQAKIGTDIRIYRTQIGSGTVNLHKHPNDVMR